MPSGFASLLFFTTQTLIPTTLAAPDLLSGIAAILSAVAWPILVASTLLWFRKPVEELMMAAVGIASSSSKVKIWQIEFDRDVQQQLDVSASAALSRGDNVSEQQLGAPVPQAQVQAAARVRSLVDEAPPGSVRREIQESIRLRMLGFAKDYEATRASMHAGPERTLAMNAIAAKMRTLALAADPFLSEFATDESSPGKRLAAICILELAPAMEWVEWLADRMAVERPFVFFHASVGLLSAVRRYRVEHRDALRVAVSRALAQVQSFGENCDKNTVRSLTLALSELES